MQKSHPKMVNPRDLAGERKKKKKRKKDNSGQEGNLPGTFQGKGFVERKRLSNGSFRERVSLSNDCVWEGCCLLVA